MTLKGMEYLEKAEQALREAVNAGPSNQAATAYALAGLGYMLLAASQSDVVQTFLDNESKVGGIRGRD